MTASARSDERAPSAETSSRWHIWENARWSSSRQNAVRNARGGGGRDAIDDQLAWNEEFHALVIAASGSARLSAALRATAGIPRSFRTAFWSDDAHRAFSQTCHRELVSALVESSAERAEAVMRMHILRAKDALVAVTNGD